MLLTIKKGLHMNNETLHRVKGSIIASGIASILLGILFLAEPLMAGVSICYFIGGLLVIAGITKVIFCCINTEGVAQSIIGGVILFLFGLLCLTRPDVVASILSVMAGIYIIADGTVKLNEGIFAVRAKIKGGIPVVIFSVIFMICGFYVMFVPFAFIMVVAGVVMVCDGIFNLIFAGLMSKRINEAKQTFKN